ncbi:MAG TPA: tetratricopeptide repeat protein [Thermoanaerobaculia bacterium]|nr:tetratricopeptide repeat protein [Thermoanaerobaculia bacterium]
MSRRFATAVMAAVLLAAAPLAAQEWRGRARVEGTVKNAKGEPIANAKVSLRWTESGKGGPDLTTNKAGHWGFFGLAGGSWNIDFEAPGYVTRQISAHFDEATRNPPIDIQLEAVAPAAEATHEELQISGHKVSKEAAAAVQAANAALEAKNFPEARANYEKALQEMPDYAPLMMSIAKTYAGENNDAEAINWARKAAAADPQNASAWKTVAELELSRGNLDAGKEALSKVPPDQITDTSYLNLGILLYNKKQAGAAEEAFGKAVELNPDLADAYYYRGLARIQLKRTPEAKADLTKYLQLVPTGGDADTAKELLKSLQ